MRWPLSKREWYDLRWGFYYGAAIAGCVFIGFVAWQGLT
jgi:hypothetical protein